MGTEVRQFPAQYTRVETGPIQFGDDHTGIFMRGDFCLAMVPVLDYHIDEYRKLHPDTGSAPLFYLERIRNTMARVSAIERRQQSTDGGAPHS